jgi:peptidoglycan/LPS O-acetylase OafA/YrhL
MVLVVGAGAAFAGLAVLAVLGVLPGDRSDYVLAYGAISALGLFGLIRMEDAGIRPSKGNWLVRLGDASFVLYLIHVPVLSALCKLARSLSDHWGPFGPWASALVALMIVLVCCAVAMGFHLLVEKPTMQRLNALSHRLFPDRIKLELANT